MPPIPESAAGTGPRARAAAAAADYLALARPGHWVKHVLILPGVVVAQLLHPRPLAALAVSMLLGFLAAAALASANYVLNDWFDARFDARNPHKADRPAVRARLSPPLVILEYLLLAALGLALAAAVSGLFLGASLAFLAGAWIYNVPPIRAKDHTLIDVLTESLNNPIRLTLGWAMVDSMRLPPASLVLAYWMGGAFLMAIKRLAELRGATATGDLEQLRAYRRSFAGYTESSLLLSCFIYAQMAAFFLAVFLVKYRIEYILALPLFAILFTVYLRLGLRPESPAERPERLAGEPTLLVVVALLIAAMILLTTIDVPFLERLSEPHFIRLGEPND